MSHIQVGREPQQGGKIHQLFDQLVTQYQHWTCLKYGQECFSICRFKALGGREERSERGETILNYSLLLAETLQLTKTSEQLGMHKLTDNVTVTGSP